MSNLQSNADLAEPDGDWFDAASEFPLLVLCLSMIALLDGDAVCDWVVIGHYSFPALTVLMDAFADGFVVRHFCEGEMS